jgi:2,4-dienoyl-CoA reductase-like NADH-dependent reductase (Old Yellow Enzyme family)/thioredoxin reductase
MRYPHLFSPFELKSLTIRNRIVQTAHDKHYSRAGLYTQRDVDYQLERARGGVGLIVTGARAVHPTSVGSRATFAYLREAVGPDGKLVQAVHGAGAAIFAQLSHSGANPPDDGNDDLRVSWGPSAGRAPSTGNAIKAMELEEINDLVHAFGRSAEIARASGFDGIELHFAHSYLVHQFISPLHNVRTDEYGGTAQRRLKLALDIVSEIRKRIGHDYVVGARIAVSDFVPGGVGVDDAIEVGRALQESGGVDYLSLSTGTGDKRLMVAASDVPDGWLVPDAARIKAALPTVPTIVVGGIKQPALAESLVATGVSDLVGMTRAQIADPELARKAQEGREDEIYHCIRANQGCIASAFGKGGAVRCTINPGAGRERLLGVATLRPAAKQKRWLVIGGGPAGMKAAETLAKRGHAVTLLEKDASLGGQVNLIVKTPGRAEFEWITRDLTVQMRKHGVDVQLSTEAEPATVRALTPESIIVATGAIPASDATPSAHGSPSMAPSNGEQDNALTVWDVLLQRKPIGSRVVVIDEEGTRSTGGAVEFLLDMGRSVELVTSFGALFPSTADTLDMPFLLQRLFAKGLTCRMNTRVTSVQDRAVRTIDLYSGTESTLADVDTVVRAALPRANDGLYFALKKEFTSVQRIGDCVAPRKLDHAIYEGALAGREMSAEDHYIREGELEQWV